MLKKIEKMLKIKNSINFHSVIIITIIEHVETHWSALKMKHLH